METIGIIMNGVTGRMGSRQHLERSIIAIREQGGVLLANGKRVMPDPILVGRNEEKLRALGQQFGITRISTDLDECLADPYYQIYFDAQTTLRRAEDVKKAIAAGKHIYCEKPTAVTSEEALELAQLASEKGVKNGVVQDKLFLPGLLKLKRLIDSGFFGDILSVRGEFGYWVFEGDWQPAQRPSWNYRKEDGGGIIVDMLCHWRYVLSNLFGKIEALSCFGKTHIGTRYDESGKPYTATADDAAYTTFELEGGIVAHINSSWNVRVNRDELFELQIDGTQGSAVAGLRNCKIQHRVNTPKAIWNPDIEDPNNYRGQWMAVPMNGDEENGFKIQWEMFLRHVAGDEPYRFDLLEGAKGVQLAELGLKSWEERRWLEVQELKLQVPTERSSESV
ncbi:Gfo/Idh/MocA family oxidoreductase [Pullulanibacillus sp. KACC 23026]|uniref:Gfo/Idh/MocA family protein n=1 Tax=Pullulanibacillus sp. KACC 23026 TaxID=3028315 RepID=UPI0023AF05FB|nr:Gfo/Idh/MocA family oxidoreductase [Pullulanibacillus sp. KACC 23026]WEG13689.1 Gfo/Idh/MocA family oxidoreductase [Pullulanibacillus sp. KACC 23026]